MISHTLNRYIWLLNTLLQQKRLTFEQISLMWKDSYLGNGKPLALRTFHMHREAISELFGVDILCDASTYEYYVSNPEDLRSDKGHKWLLNSFTISNMVIAGHNMKDRILFEDIPGGTEYIQTVIAAMRRGKELLMDYQPFDGQRKTCHIQPYAMKVYEQRWYIVGRITESGKIRNIALDRTRKMELTERSFTVPEEFNAEVYYMNTVGIFVNEELKVRKVVLRAYDILVEYLRSLPMHDTQKEIKTEDKFSDFRYHLCLTPELTTKILSMGDKVEVLEPAELRETIKNKLCQILKLYQSNECGR